MIDWTRVNELRNDLGVEDFEEITALFLEEVEDRLESLAGHSGTQLAEDLHFLKGSAANLGFVKMREVCESAEADVARCDLATVLNVYSSSKAEFLSDA